MQAKPQTVDNYIAAQRAALALNPECGMTHYNLAVALLSRKRYAEAEQELHAAVECSPGLAEAYVQLGGICLQRGDLDGCLHYNQQAVASRAGFAEGYGNIGFVHLQRGNIPASIAALKKAIAFNSRFIQAYTTLANAYLMQGNVQESIETNLKAIALEPRFGIAHNNLAIAYLEKGEIEKAARHCDQALALGFEVAPEIISEIKARRPGGSKSPDQ